MSKVDFYSLTLREFYAKLKGHRRRTEREGREEWERARIVAYFAALPHLKKGTKPTSMLPFAWDNTSASITPEEALKILREAKPIPLSRIIPDGIS